MRNLVIVSLLAATGLAGLHSSSSTGAFPDTWVDLFPPPFTNAPSIMEGIGCVSGNLCFIPAGDNNVGFQVMQFDGQFNGEFTVLNTPEGSMMSVYDTMGAGGTEAQPYGLACGMFNPAARYNASTWLTPLTLPLVMSVDVRFDTKTGQNVGLYNGLNPEGWSFSADGGSTFSSYPATNVNPPLPNPTCMWPRYSSMGGANPSVVFQTFGNWPGNDNVDAKSSRRYRVNPNRKSSTVPKHLLPERIQQGLKDQNCGYNAGITKSSDGGKTWSAVFSDTTSFYFNQIDCADELRCVAVGESIWNATGTGTGSRIYTTKDGGNSWARTYYQENNGTFTNSLMSVRFSVVNASEVWVGGGSQNNGNPEGIMLKSTDGGYSWRNYVTLDYVGEVLDLSFTKDGNAFAAAITEFDDSTLLRYNANGPAPTTPSPYTGMISQYLCTDNGCSVGCNVTQIPQQTCQSGTGDNAGTSQQFRCSMSDDVVIDMQYPLSSKCTFVAEQGFFQIGACYYNNNGPGTVMYTCGTSSVAEEEGAIPKPVKIVGKTAPRRTRK